MSIYRVPGNPGLLDADTIDPNMFGTNFVAHFDSELTQGEHVQGVLASLGASTMRYPGGAITEEIFNEVDFSENGGLDSFLAHEVEGASMRTHIDQFINAAAGCGASVRLVLPTSIGFGISAGEALLEGRYGSRSNVSQSYLELIRDYVEEFMSLGEARGVEISSIEIGNEFWGSGQMTATEYGALAATVTAYLAPLIGDIEIVAQVASAANIFSPRNDYTVFVSVDGEDYTVHTSQPEANLMYDVVEVVMPGQGSSSDQTRAIASAFQAEPDALSALDGIVQHIYFNGGFDGIDNEREHGLYSTPQTFANAVGLPEIDYHITEWGPRGVRSSTGIREPGSGNEVGLQYASSILEAFFELAESGVDSANFWPLTFGNPIVDHRTLIDTSEADLTFGGHSFRMLSESVSWLSPLFDFEVAGQIDVHGFSNEDQLVAFISERSGLVSGQDISLDFSGTGFHGSAVVSFESLGETGSTGVDVRANPIVTSTGAFMGCFDEVNLSLDAWNLARVIMQPITNQADTLGGTDMADRFVGRQGDDSLYGLSGNDSLRGNQGNDSIYGGDGRDWLRGGWGDDELFGGEGDDHLFGNANEDQIYGGAGDDFISGGAGADHIFGGLGSDNISSDSGNDTVYGGAFNDIIASTGGDNYLFGNLGSDTLSSGNGWDHLSGGHGDDYLDSGAGNDVLAGGTGQDRLVARSGDDSLFGGYGEDNLFGGNGADLIFGGIGDDRLVGHSGQDSLYGGNGNDTLIAGAGDDLLSGGFGNDNITGGAGADTFVFSGIFGVDRITDFGTGEAHDVLDISGWAGIDGYDDLVSNHLYTTSTGVVVIDDYAGNRVLLFDLTEADIEDPSLFLL